VNIKDVDVASEYLEFAKGKDMMVALFDIVEATNEAYGDNLEELGSINTRETQAEIRHLAWCVIEEMCEAVNQLKTRRWTKTELKVDLEHYDDEVADTIIFFVKWLMAGGYTPERILDLVLRKSKVNVFRIKSGY